MRSSSVSDRLLGLIHQWRNSLRIRSCNLLLNLHFIENRSISISRSRIPRIPAPKFRHRRHHFTLVIPPNPRVRVSAMAAHRRRKSTHSFHSIIITLLPPTLLRLLQKRVIRTASLAAQFLRSGACNRSPLVIRLLAMLPLTVMPAAVGRNRIVVFGGGRHEGLRWIGVGIVGIEGDAGGSEFAGVLEADGVRYVVGVPVSEFRNVR